MTDIDLIVLLLHGEGIRQKYDQFTGAQAHRMLYAHLDPDQQTEYDLTLTGRRASGE